MEHELKALLAAQQKASEGVAESTRPQELRAQQSEPEAAAFLTHWSLINDQ